MTPRERLAAHLLDVAPELTPVQYEVIMGAADEYAAAMIERHAHPPLPAEFTARHPKSRDHRTLAEQAADEAASPAGA